MSVKLSHPPLQDTRASLCDRDLFGWRVQTDLPLPELQAWTGGDRAPDVLIRLGPVPALGDGGRHFSPRIEFTETALRFDVPGVARYLIDGADRITIETAPGVAPDLAEVRLFFFGTVLAVLCFRRGLIPLHASAVEVDGRALLLAGNSGLGKSTMAAALMARGYPLLSDDLCALDVSRPGGPVILPCIPHLKLWKDAAARLSINIDPLAPVRVGLGKFRVPVQPAVTGPLPPGQIVMLHRTVLPTEAGIQSLRGMAALRYDLIHRRRLGVALGYHGAMLLALAELLKVAPIAQFSRMDDLDALPDLADQVLELTRGRGPTP
jgi:hypothetical protein